MNPVKKLNKVSFSLPRLEIVNKYKLKKTDLTQIKRSAVKALTFLSAEFRKNKKIEGPLADSGISVVICGNNLITNLNRRYFKKSIPTDVISFPLADSTESGYLGEVVVSAQQACLVSKTSGLPWKQELVLYITHGILHLLGYNDINKAERKIMEKKQWKIMAKLGILKITNNQSTNKPFNSRLVIGI